MPQRFAANNLALVEPIRGSNIADAKRSEAYSRRPDTTMSGAQMPAVDFSAFSDVHEEFRAQIQQMIADNAWIMDELAKL